MADELKPTDTLGDLTSICNDIFARWDADQRPGKLLLALVGEVRDYDPRVDRVRAALANTRIEPEAGVSEAWQLIETAPPNRPVEVRLGTGMVIVARLVLDGSMTSDEEPCDQWQAEYEGEHPECWSDGCCWQNNADDVCSMQPTHWRSGHDEPLLGESEMAELVARINGSPNLHPAIQSLRSEQEGGR